MSSLGPEGQGKRGTYLVGLSRPSETTLLYTLVPWSWGKSTQQVFEKPGWVKVNPGQILFGSLKSRIQFLGLEGGLSDEEVSGGPGQGKRIIYIGVWRLSETNTNKFQETRLSKSKPRSKFVWIHKISIWLGSHGREIIPYTYWCHEAEGNEPNKILRN